MPVLSRLRRLLLLSCLLSLLSLLCLLCLLTSPHQPADILDCDCSRPFPPVLPGLSLNRTTCSAAAHRRGPAQRVVSFTFFENTGDKDTDKASGIKNDNREMQSIYLLHIILKYL